MSVVEKRLPLSKDAENQMKAYMQKRTNMILDIAEIRAKLVLRGTASLPTEISGDDVAKAIMAFEVLEQ